VTRFDVRLAAQVALVLAACSGGEPDPELWCDGELPEDFEIQDGYVVVPFGEDCPAPEDVGSGLNGFGCPGPTFQGEVCSFVERHDEQQQTVYGGFTDIDPGTPYAGDYGQEGDVCVYTGVFEPDTSGAVCGRPMLADGAPVLAETASRADWLGALRPDPTGLSEADREAVGAYWLEAARMEHASVASFARLTLELVRFGAPPELLIGAQQAGLDEVEHARVCFALASGYLGLDVGPGPMGLDGAAELASSKKDFAEAVLREGCVGETLAVLDAAARLVETTDPAARAVLEAVVEDEGRHAALAWKTLAWLLEEDAALRGHLEEVLATLRPGLGGEDGAVATSHGLLSDRRRQAVLRDGFDRVVMPSWRELPLPL